MSKQQNDYHRIAQNIRAGINLLLDALRRDNGEGDCVPVNRIDLINLLVELNGAANWANGLGDSHEAYRLARQVVDAIKTEEAGQ